jgi:hypothetical protein
VIPYLQDDVGGIRFCRELLFASALVSSTNQFSHVLRHPGREEVFSGQFFPQTLAQLCDIFIFHGEFHPGQSRST